jgi:hypothetical protein
MGLKIEDDVVKDDRKLISLVCPLNYVLGPGLQTLTVSEVERSEYFRVNIPRRKKYGKRLEIWFQYHVTIDDFGEFHVAFNLNAVSQVVGVTVPDGLIGM